MAFGHVKFFEGYDPVTRYEAGKSPYGVYQMTVSVSCGESIVMTVSTKPVQMDHDSESPD